MSHSENDEYIIVCLDMANAGNDHEIDLVWCQVLMLYAQIPEAWTKYSDNKKSVLVSQWKN